MILSLHDVTFAYRNHIVLHNVSFSVKEGDFFCVLGPNGVGKSTLFRCILGMNSNYKGKIQVGNKPLHTYSTKALAQYMSYIPQYTTPIFSYTVFQVVLMGTTAKLSMFGNPKKIQEEKALYALRQLGIEMLKNKRIDEISGGERQLVLIARAIAQDARLIIMDEPTANLDYGNQVRVLEILKYLTKKGYSILMSTHNPEQAFLYGTHIVMLKNGQIVSKGNPEEVLTEQVLSDTYGVEIGLKQVVDENRTYHICIPKGGSSYGISME